MCLYTGGEDLARPTQTQVDRLNRLRNQVMARMEAAGIATRQGTHAVHTLSYYSRRYGLEEQDFPSAYAADRLSIALPLYVGMTDLEAEEVVGALADFNGA